MKNHINVNQQAKHLIANKNMIVTTQEELVDFLNEIPYGLSIQQVKYFFKTEDGNYLEQTYENWKEKYIFLCKDSLRMFQQILFLESRLKNHIFQKTHEDLILKDIVLKTINKSFQDKTRVDKNKEIEYYSLINSASMGDLINVLEYINYEGKNIVTIREFIKICRFPNSTKAELEMIRTSNKKSYLQFQVKANLSDGILVISEFNIVKNFIKKEIKNWILSAIYNNKSKYLNKLYTPFLTYIFSSSIYDELTKCQTVESKLFIKYLDEVITSFNETGKINFKLFAGKIKINQEIVYKMVEESVNNSFKEAIKTNQGLAFDIWSSFFETNGVTLEYIMNELVKESYDEQRLRSAEFNSTIKLLRIHKQFRDQIAHGKTICETLKTSNDIELKNFVLRNLVDSKYKIDATEYISLNDYWKKNTN